MEEWLGGLGAGWVVGHFWVRGVWVGEMSGWWVLVFVLHKQEALGIKA